MHAYSLISHNNHLHSPLNDSKNKFEKNTVKVKWSKTWHISLNKTFKALVTLVETKDDRLKKLFKSNCKNHMPDLWGRQVASYRPSNQKINKKYLQIITMFYCFIRQIKLIDWLNWLEKKFHCVSYNHYVNNIRHFVKWSATIRLSNQKQHDKARFCTGN